MTKIVNIMFVVVCVGAIALVCFYGTRYLQSKGVLDYGEFPLPRNVIEIPSPSQLESTRFLEISGHSFEHRDSCTCKLY